MSDDNDIIDRLYAHSMDGGDPTLMFEAAQNITKLRAALAFIIDMGAPAEIEAIAREGLS